MSDPPSPAASSTAVKGGSAIALAIGIMNVSTYAFTIFAAQAMGPGAFGGFAAAMNVLLVCAVLALGMQATAARRIAREPADALAVQRTIFGVGVRAALGVGLLLLALAPLVNQVLRLESLATAVVLAAAVVPTTLLGAQLGVLQGERRWLPLAAVYLSAGVPRVLIGVLLLLWRPEVLVAMCAVAIGAVFPVLVAAWVLRGSALGVVPGGTSDRAAPTARELWSETFHNSGALFAFLALSSIDIVLARNALDLHDAGLYAGGLIMVKAVTFLPQFVVVLAFPSMGTDDTGRRALLISLGLVALTGIAVVIGVQVLPDLALIFVGGDEFAEISDRLWLFAILGTVLSMLQLLVYSVLAQQARRLVVLVWVSLVPLMVVGLTSSTVSQMLTRVLAVDSVLLALLLTFALVRLRKPQTTGSVPG